MGEEAGTTEKQSAIRRPVHVHAMPGEPSIYVTAGIGGRSIDVEQACQLIEDLVRAISEVNGRRPMRRLR